MARSETFRPSAVHVIASLAMVLFTAFVIWGGVRAWGQADDMGRFMTLMAILFLAPLVLGQFVFITASRLVFDGTTVTQRCLVMRWTYDARALQSYRIETCALTRRIILFLLGSAVVFVDDAGTRVGSVSWFWGNRKRARERLDELFSRTPPGRGKWAAEPSGTPRLGSSGSMSPSSMSSRCAATSW